MLSDLVVVGTGLCAAAVVTGLDYRSFSVRWLRPSAPSLPEEPIPGLLIPTLPNWYRQADFVRRRLDEYENWLRQLSPNAPPVTRLAVTALQQSDVISRDLTIGLIDVTALYASLINRCTERAIPIETTDYEIVRDGETVTGIRTLQGDIPARAIILANGIQLSPFWRDPAADASALGSQVIVTLTPTPAPYRWTYRFPFQKHVYIAGDPERPLNGDAPSETATPSSGIGIRPDDAFRAEQSAPGLVNVIATGSGGLLGLPLITRQVLAVLGIADESPS